MQLHIHICRGVSLHAPVWQPNQQVSAPLRAGSLCRQGLVSRLKRRASRCTEHGWFVAADDQALLVEHAALGSNRAPLSGSEQVL